MEYHSAPNKPHPDSLAVYRFACSMQKKLAHKRAQGRSGWEDKSQCSNEYLSGLLHEHVQKGDPVDVGNLAMMIHQRGERISPAQEGLELYRHVKSGGVYKVLMHASLESDRSDVVVYVGSTGRVWVRPAAEFYDGRFEKVAA